MDRFPLIFWLTSGLAVLVGVAGAGLHVFFSVNRIVLVVLIVAACWSLGVFEEGRNRNRPAESRNVDDFSFSSPLFRPLVFSATGVLAFFMVLD